MSINKVILVGNLGKDPETRYMASGEAVTNATLATTDSWKDKSGEKQSKTEWHNLVFYKKLAEIAGEYLKKGSQVYIEGKIQTRKWQTKEGQDRYTTEIIVNEMQMLGGKSEQAPKERTEKTEQKAPANSGYNDFPDDLPFAPHGKQGAGVSWRVM